MGVSVAAGHPAYSGTFIPEIWSGKLLVKFYDATVLGDITNTDYEGEIKSQGDKVIIRQTPTMTIRDYSKGQTLVTEKPEAPVLNLNIDRAKYFSFTVDDIDRYQSDVNVMDDWSADAGEQMKIAVDSLVLGTVYADAHAKNQGATAGVKSGKYNLGTTGSPIQLTKTNILDYFVDMGTVLDEQNVPEQGRFIVLPPWACGLIKKSDLRDASITGDGESILRNGRLGMIDRFTIYRSNLLATTFDTPNTVTNIIFGTNHAISFAAQMTEMESLKGESTFGTIVRGLNVFGFKTLKTEALGRLYAYL
jgi:hypothetical protein